MCFKKGRGCYSLINKLSLKYTLLPPIMSDILEIALCHFKKKMATDYFLCNFNIVLKCSFYTSTLLLYMLL